MVKKIRRVIISIDVIMFVLFILYVIYLMYHGKKQFLDRKYSGVITEIRVLPGNRDLPDIKIHNEWLPFSIDDAKVKNYIQVGDSIVKASGSPTIKVYRKNIDKWNIKEFK